jgi:YggT family protein
MNTWQQASIFLLGSLLDCYIFILVLRFFLQWFRADYYNPLTQLIAKLSSPVVNPLSRILPTIHNINIAALVAIVLLEIIKIYLLVWLGSHTLINILGGVTWALGDLLTHVTNLFFYAILVQAILSWLRPQGANPVLEIAYRLALPVLKPFQRIIPPVAGFDLSPIPAMLLLKAISFYIAFPLMVWGLHQ